MGVMGIVIAILLVVNMGYITYLLRRPREGRDFKRLEERLIRMEGTVREINPAIDRNFRENRKEMAEGLVRLQNSNETSLLRMQAGNERKLDEMRETVDEKLKASVEKRFNESFRAISTQLTQVYQGLGEMKYLATGVGDLK